MQHLGAEILTGKGVRCGAMGLSILFFVLVLVPVPLHAWGREGHEVIAMIAEKRLDPRVQEQANVLLERHSLPRSRELGRSATQPAVGPLALCQYSDYGHWL